MKGVLRKIIYCSTCFLILSGLASCSLERKVAREYIEKDHSRSLLVIPPSFIFKVSLKEWQLDSAEMLADSEIDSLLFENSLYLKYIDDSIFLDYYISNYIAEMEGYGFEVYVEDSLSAFLTGKNNAFIVNMAQLELEEYVMPIKEEEEFGGYIYYEVIDLNAVNLNSWFEISRVNGNENVELFFSSMYATDGLDGLFKYNYFTGEVQFQYEIDTLTLDAIYRLGALAGYTYAGYTFDYLLNSYIDKRMQEEGRYRSDVFYHYNRQQRYLTPANNRFIPME